MDEKALKIVRDYIMEHLDKSDTIPPFDWNFGAYS